MVEQTTLGHVIAIGRFPVKSLGGEHLDSAVVEQRGVVGDRLWAVRDVDGKFGSGKSTRRFRRMPGLLALTAGYDRDRTPVVRFPDGRSIRADDAGIHDALSAHVGRAVTLAREAEVSRFDEDDWIGRTLAIGADVVVRVRKPMIRCVMVDLPQADLAADGQLLDTIGRVNDTKLDLVVDVVQPGALRLGDTVRATSRN